MPCRALDRVPKPFGADLGDEAVEGGVAHVALLALPDQCPDGAAVSDVMTLFGARGAGDRDVIRADTEEIGRLSPRELEAAGDGLRRQQCAPLFREVTKSRREIASAELDRRDAGRHMFKSHLSSLSSEVRRPWWGRRLLPCRWSPGRERGIARPDCKTPPVQALSGSGRRGGAAAARAAVSRSRLPWAAASALIRGRLRPTAIWAGRSPGGIL